MLLKLQHSILLLAVFWCSSLAAQESATEIVKKADDLMRGKTMTGTYVMTITRPQWRRSMEFKFWSEGTDKSFILILAPAKEKGVTFLKLNKEMWNYVPKINRIIKVPPSMMLQSWMGSDFTNDDLVKESSVVKDYEHELLGRSEMNGQAVYKVALRPKPQAAVVWDKIIEWIRVKDYIPIKAEYFNERGEKVRTLLFSEIRQFGKRRLPAKIELIEEKKPGHRTTLVLKEATFDRPIKKSIFTKQFLKRAR